MTHAQHEAVARGHVGSAAPGPASDEAAPGPAAGNAAPGTASDAAPGTASDAAPGPASDAAPGPASDADDPACAVAHGAPAPAVEERVLIAVFASPVAEHLLRYGADLGFRGILLEPDADRARAANLPGVDIVTEPPARLDASVDVVVTDHHRPELGTALRDLLAVQTRWIGLMGNPRHPGPHIEALTQLGVPAADIDRVQRPVGLNIGSRTPAEIAIATLAGLVADRNGRPGGFDF
jgi:xanthine/CO dehydrogenase XdhC/CoxF family maturation factor